MSIGSRTRLFNGVFLPVLFMFSFADASAYSIYLNGVVSGERDEFRLGEIARVEGSSQTDRISSRLVVRNLQAPLYISAGEIAERLGRDGLPPDRVYGSGVWLVPLVKRLERDDLMKEIVVAVESLKDGPEFLKNASLKVLSPNGMSMTPEGAKLIFRLPDRASHLRAGRRIVGADLVVVDADGRERILRRSRVDLQIRIRRRVAVARTDLRRNDRLSPGDWILEEREIDDEKAIHPIERLDGRRLMATVKAGDVLTGSVIQLQPAVRRGGRVDLVHQTGGVVVKCRSIAGQSGEIGDVIAVRPLTPSRRKAAPVKARIVGEGAAVLLP